MKDRNLVKIFVRSVYQVQKLRIQVGNRLVGNFKAKLGQAPGQSEDVLDDASKALLAELRILHSKLAVPVAEKVNAKATEAEEIDETEEEKGLAGKGAPAGSGKISKLIATLISKRYSVITEKKKTFPLQSAFKGDPVISSFTELCLASEYFELERAENQHFRRLEGVLTDFPVYTEFLRNIKGIGPAIAGILISEIDIAKAKYPSSIWKYAGLSVEKDGTGTSRRKEHLVKATYTNSKGEVDERVSITFNPFLKTKILGVLSPSLLRAGNEEYGKIYRDYKHRLENHAKYGVQNDGQKDDHGLWVGKARRHAMAIRYTAKMFLFALYKEWRRLENLPISPPYSEWKLGQKHGE